MKKNNMIYYIATFLVFSFMLSIDVYAYCPLGPDVTKDLYGVLMILKIVAPFLCIILSVFDAIKAVTKGDPSSELKNVAKKFGKRMLYAVILFFLPVLVDIVFQAADVWDAHGTCDLFNPEDNKTQSTSSTRTRTTENCAGITDQENCERDQKCYWSSTDNSCHLLNWVNSTGTVSTSSATEYCAGITNQEYCERDQKCYWSYNDSSCHLRN